MHQLAHESKEIRTRILWNDVDRTFHVQCSDSEVLPIFTRLARSMGVKAGPDGSWTFPARAELGPDNFSEEARRRIEFGVARNVHKDEPTPQVPEPKVTTTATISGPEKPAGVSPTASREVALTIPTGSAPDPRDGPTAKPIDNAALKHLFGG